MTEPYTPMTRDLPAELDGFRVELDAANERADVVLDRPPLNVIMMPQRDQLRLASETCLYALPEQRLGQIPGSGGSARLQKMVGITRTKDIVMRSRRITGRQASDWGVATDCVPDGELEKATDALVAELRGFAP